MLLLSSHSWLKRSLWVCFLICKRAVGNGEWVWTGYSGELFSTLILSWTSGALWSCSVSLCGSEETLSYQEGTDCLVIFLHFQGLRSIIPFRFCCPLAPKTLPHPYNQRCPPQQSPGRVGKPMAHCLRESHLHLVPWLSLSASHSCSCWPVFAAICISNKLIKATN